MKHDADFGPGSCRIGGERYVQASDQAETVALGHLAPALPAEHRGPVSEDDLANVRLNAGVEPRVDPSHQCVARVVAGH